MSVKLQILCIVASFIYGIFIKLCNLFNKRNNILTDLFYVYDLVILYIIIIYKINLGIFHIYFIFFIIIGYVFMSKNVKFLIKIKDILKSKIIK